MSSKKILIVVMLLFYIASALGQESNITSGNTTSNITMESFLETWHIGPYVNQTVFFYADFVSMNGTLIGSCELNGDAMQFNQSNYYFTNIFAVPSNYTYEISCTASGYETQVKTRIANILPVPDLDADDDYYVVPMDCNDNNANINPGEEEVLGNGLDDDCSPKTKDAQVLNITTNKENYALSETVLINITANNETDTYITINTPTNVSYIYIFSNGTYPVTQQFSLTGLAGLYSIEAVNYYQDNVKQAYNEFIVGSPMILEISVNDTDIYVGERVKLRAIVSGNSGNVNTIWNMDDGTQKYGLTINHTYSAAKSYNVVLVATDQGGGQVIKSKQIIVKPAYYLKVKVVDNSTSEIIKNATVKLDGKELDVNSSGMVEYKTTNATYKLKASAPYYIGYSEDIKLNKSLVFTIRLTRSREDQKPVVSLISPGNNGVFDGIFKFKFTDNTDADCSLYLSEEVNWWIESAKLENLDSGKEYSITSDAEEKEYKWKILCKDEDGNTGESQVYVVKPKEVEELATSSIVQDVYDVIPDFETYGPDERRIVQFLDLEVVLKDAQRKLEMANRDLFNLRTVTNPDDYETKRQEILKRLETIKDETPLIVRSKNKANFVKYADDTELENLLDEYMGLKGREIKNKKSLLETNKELQKRFMIQSSAYNIEVEYISGRKDEITLVIREIESAGEKDTYVESIPKSIIESAKDIVFVTPVNVLKEDPLFESSLGAGKIVYYVKRSMNLDDLPKITAAVISTEEAGVSSVTGFAILDGLGLNDSNKKVFFIQLIIVFILLGVYIYYSTDRTTIFMGGKKDAARETMAVEPAKHIGRKNVETKYVEKNYVERRDVGSDKISYLKELIASIHALADVNLKDAAIKYYELKLLYGTLDESEKSLLYFDVMRLSDEIGSRHIISLVNEAMANISEGNDEEAHKIYMDIEVEFEKLSDGMKAEVYQRCCDIGMRLKDG